jgi:phosphatidyl-myo-inositol dimannoside synthase
VNILFMTPQCYPGPGGIPAYMRRLREVLNEYAFSRGATVHCLSLNDTDENLSAHARPVDATMFSGCGGSKARFVARATRLSLRNRYDLAIVGLLGMAPAAYWLKLIRSITSYIVVLHGIEAWVKAPTVERIAARNAQAIISTTNYTATQFSENNDVDPSKNRVIPLCIAESQAAIRARSHPFPQSGREFTLLSVARLDSRERRKGIDTTIEAMPRIVSAIPEARFLVAGGGDDSTRLDALIQKLGVEDNVRLLGVVEDSVLQQLYRQCDVMVLPSEQEGFGIVFLEAMSYGKPCIGAAYGGIPEVIIDGNTGYLVSFGDSDAVARCVVGLASDSNLARRMGMAGLEQVLKHYCYESFCTNFSGLFDELIFENRTKRMTPQFTPG